MPQRPTSPTDVPDVVPIFPLTGALLLPFSHRPLNIFEPRYLEMVDRALATDRLIGLIQPEDTSEESPQGQVPLHEIGCLGRLTHFEESGDGRYFIILEGVTRFRILEEIKDGAPFRKARISAEGFGADFTHNEGEEAVDRMRFLKMMRDYAEFASIELNWEEIERTGTADLVNFCAMVSPYGPAEKQVLLEAQTLFDRAETLIAMTEYEMARGGKGAVPLN
ncbi:peptidase S16 [Devosia soli]|uniref:Peptidase S16 n=1 Tax=Devosia soli TaxID=361041 RepID=A0A0F5L8X1_9HYPH|nr:LON peptidase substrate-binding domain-containing protein [Devosia soli]KKB78695.1 peptidase S16 [Devosia soli]